MNILFNKTREVKTPDRAYGTGDAFDFYIPEYSPRLVSDIKERNKKNKVSVTVENDTDLTIHIEPHSNALIPSGIRVIISDPDTCLLAINKSGISAKKRLLTAAMLVDHDFTGEIFFSFINVGDETVTLKPGEKVIQFMHMPLLRSNLQEISTEDFFKFADGSKRGVGAFGSSGQH